MSRGRPTGRTKRDDILARKAVQFIDHGLMQLSSGTTELNLDEEFNEAICNLADKIARRVKTKVSAETIKEASDPIAGSLLDWIINAK